MTKHLRYTGVALLSLIAATSSHGQGTAATPTVASAQATSATATPSSLTTPLATYGDKQVTIADYEAWLNGTVPERDRFGWAMDQKRILDTINGLLKIRTVADEAKRRGLDKDPQLKLRVEQFTEKVLQEMMLQRIEEEANREF